LVASAVDKISVAVSRLAIFPTASSIGIPISKSAVRAVGAIKWITGIAVGTEGVAGAMPGTAAEPTISNKMTMRRGHRRASRGRQLCSLGAECQEDCRGNQTGADKRWIDLLH
jgi:hypothetical protein